MITFVLQGSSPRENKRSLRTHCPTMIRFHTQGQYFSEEICRCDLVEVQTAKNHPRCKSTSECMPRQEILSSGKDIVSIHKIRSVP